MDEQLNLLDWYWDLPVITRMYFTGAFATTTLCALDIVSPYHLYFNYRQVFARGELWRLATNFLFFGSLGVDFLFHMYFVIRYCRALEEGSFGHRSADFLWCLLFGATALMLIAPWVNVLFFGSSLTFMLVYLWAKRNPNMQISLLGLLAFNAPYLPWVLLVFSGLMGQEIVSDILGIAVGHAYYYLEDVWPAIAAARGWRRCKRPMGTPFLLHWAFGTHREPSRELVRGDVARAAIAAREAAREAEREAERQREAALELERTREAEAQAAAAAAAAEKAGGQVADNVDAAVGAATTAAVTTVDSHERGSSNSRSSEALPPPSAGLSSSHSAASAAAPAAVVSAAAPSAGLPGGRRDSSVIESTAAAVPADNGLRPAAAAAAEAPA